MKLEKNKNLYRQLSAHGLLSRYYFKARGKRSTIVTARVTRKAERRLAHASDAYMYVICAFLSSYHF